MRTWTGAFAAATFAALVVGGCGKTETGGGAGSETHWLLECKSDSDCEIGSCLCGLCTVACNGLRDCPDPLDVCSTETATGVCEEKVCGSSLPAESQQGLVSARTPAVERQPACDNGRRTEVTYVDVGYRPSGPNAVMSAASTLIPESPQGFLLFGYSQQFYRIDGAGNLMRTLPPPNSIFDTVFDDAVPIDDGSLFFSGHVGDRAWVGKVDAEWNMVWEHELDMTSVLTTSIVATSDGGVAVLGQQGVDQRTPPIISSMSWAHISATGETLWQHQEATTSETLGFLGGDIIQIAFAAPEGIHLIGCDLHGNYDLPPLVRPGANLATTRLIQLPNARIGLAYLKGFLVLDDTNQVLWDHATEANVLDAAYDPTRQRIFLTGGASGSWVERLDLDGNPSWTFSREQWPVGPRDGLDWNRYGYELHQVAVDAAGHVAARAPWGSAGLDIMWLDQGACAGESVP